ncbi:hypothetical protein [Ensifer sp. 22564]|uniref:hypothetical protein n=1 Tax=Ensifer sp. 22564 TaxID=3453943 RepID=UPI003F828439
MKAYFLAEMLASVDSDDDPLPLRQKDQEIHGLAGRDWAAAGQRVEAPTLHSASHRPLISGTMVLNTFDVASQTALRIIGERRGPDDERERFRAGAWLFFPPSLP